MYRVVDGFTLIERSIEMIDIHANCARGHFLSLFFMWLRRRVFQRKATMPLRLLSISHSRTMRTYNDAWSSEAQVT